ncbi:MAG: hypothetical protein Q7T61_01890 [Caulobacter sp.]|nr:hypothetical protein [Caulobacter sp.]
MQKSSPIKGSACRSRYQLLLAIFGAIGGAAIALVSLRMQTSPLTLGMAVLGFVLSIASLQASMRWWKDADEAVREAHKSGWYWGGSAGLSAAGGLTGLLFAIPPDVSLRRFALLPGDAGLIATGLLTAVVLAFVGYWIAWAAWWLIRAR